MQFIRGDTFEFSGPVTATINGVVTDDFTGYSARSQIRTETGVLLAELTATFLDYQPAILHLISEDPTTGWTVGKAMIDVQFLTPTGKVVSTRKALITILQDVTWEL